MDMSIFASKKGFFFTVIALLIVTVLFVSLTPQSGVTLKHKVASTETRITLGNDFVETLKTSYLPMALRTSSYNALRALSEYTKAKGALFADYDEFNAIFAEVMLNGTIFCEVSVPNEGMAIDDCLATTEPLMRDRDFSQRLRDIENISSSILLLQTELNYSGFNAVLFQNNATGPFQVGVNISVNLSVNAQLAWWNSTVDVEVIFSFEGIEDPLYSVRSQEDLGVTFTNVFDQTNITAWNLSNTFKQIEWRKYKYDKNGASFLTRFTEIDEASDCCGIESLINPFAMNDPAVGNVEKPYVDWCFFGTRCPLNQPGALWNISCITDTAPNPQKFYRFSLDTYHAEVYNVTNFIYGETDPEANCNDIMQSVCDIDPDCT